MTSLDMMLMGYAVHKQSLDVLEEEGFDPADLQTEQGRALHQVLTDYRAWEGARGAVPSLAFLLTQFPGLDLPEPDGTPLPVMIGTLRRQRVVKESRVILTKALEGLSPTYDTEAIIKLEEVCEQISRLTQSTHTRRDTTLLEGSARTLARYEDQRLGCIPFLPWPWQELHRWSPGIRKSDFIVIYGRPKNKKTFYLLYFVAQMWLSGRSVLLYSKEMTEEEIWERVVAFLAGLDYDNLQLATLTDEQYERMYFWDNEIRRRHEESGGKNTIICVSGRDAPGKVDSVAWLTGKAKKYQPDLIAIDGLYLMASPNKHRDVHSKVSEISTATRDMILDIEIPVVATVQANRTKGNKAALEGDHDLDDVAHADALARDATLLLRAVASRTEETATLLITGARSMRLAGFTTHAVPCSNFGFIAPIDAKAAQQAVNQETLAVMQEQQTLEAGMATTPAAAAAIKTRRRKQSAEQVAAEEERLANELLRP